MSDSTQEYSAVSQTTVVSATSSSFVDVSFIRDMVRPEGAGFNGGALAQYMRDTSVRFNELAQRLTDPDQPFTSLDGVQMKSLLETLVEAKLVWQEARAAHDGQGD